MFTNDGHWERYTPMFVKIHLRPYVQQTQNMARCVGRKVIRRHAHERNKQLRFTKMHKVRCKSLDLKETNRLSFKRN